MSRYVLPHQLRGEQQRLALMSELLDPFERVHTQQLGLRDGWRCLEVGCGNGSISRWLAQQVGPNGHAVASDIDISYLDGVQAPNLEVRRLDILNDDVEQGAYDLVLARALLHHIASPQRALQRMIAALKPGGTLLSVEPDMLPATVAEPETVNSFWKGWLRWASSAGIDYFIGRKIPAWLDMLGLDDVAAEGHNIIFNGGSPWATYWIETLQELRPKLLESGLITEEELAELNALYQAPNYWTSVITFVATSGRKPDSAEQPKGKQ